MRISHVSCFNYADTGMPEAMEEDDLESTTQEAMALLKDEQARAGGNGIYLESQYTALVAVQRLWIRLTSLNIFVDCILKGCLNHFSRLHIY